MQYNNLFIKSTLSIFIFFSFVFFQTTGLAQNQGSSTSKSMIGGKIVDASTQEPLIGANVYIANSILGTITDENGQFVIRNVPYGVHEVIASYVSYKPQKTKINVDGKKQFYDANFALLANIGSLNEVTVTAEAPRGWKRNLERFKKEFLGTSTNSQQTKITNPFSLRFETDASENYFKAVAEDIIEIENNALGYKIHLLLEEFVIESDVTTLSYLPSFEELQPKNKREKDKWEKERLRAYNGSLRHLLAALAYQYTEKNYGGKTSKISDEGFVLGALTEVRTDDYWYENTIEQESIIFERNTKFEKTLNIKNLDYRSMINFDPTKHKIIAVNYTKELEERNYINYVLDKNGELGERNKAQKASITLGKQNSFLIFRKEEVHFNNNGTLVSPTDILVNGYMGFERVAELLPIEYDPYQFQQKIASLHAQIVIPQFIADTVNSKEPQKINRSLPHVALNDTKLSTTLNTLIDQRNELLFFGESDPETGIKFIETVTQNELSEIYKTASDMYLWGFSGTNIDSHVDKVVEEAGRILPLLEDAEKEIWNKLIKDKNPSLAYEITGFWFKKDPRSSTPENERLIEHWERIAHSRKHFKRNRNSVYKTDDRGFVYVKYGAPDRTKRGNLGANNSEFMRWMGDIKAFLEKDENPNESPFVDDSGRQIDSFEIMGLQWFPEYEVWVYGDLSNEQTVPYVFGQREGRAYGLINSVEELIPERLFAKRGMFYITDRYGKQKAFSPGGLIQMVYYSDLMMADDSFYERYTELEGLWTTSLAGVGAPPDPNTVNSYRYRYTARDNESPAKRYAPKTVSDVEKNIRKIPLSYAQMRLLNSQNQPKLSVVAISFPAIYGNNSVESLTINLNAEPNYILNHSLLIRDGKWNEVGTLNYQMTDDYENTTIFLIDHNDSTLNYVFEAEAFPKDSTYLGQHQVGKVILDPVEPLSTDLATLEVSDLITGIQIPEAARDSNYPFPVIPAKQISKGDQLWVYLEVYHLLMGSDDKAQYEVEFTMQRTKKRRFRRDTIETISQKFNYDSLEPTSKQSISFDVTDLDAGDYDFEVVIFDRLSGQRKVRKGSFKVIE